MNKLRVFQYVKRKRTASGFSVKNLGMVLLILMIVPYIITFLSGNIGQGEGENSQKVSRQLKESRFTVVNKTDYGSEKIPLEVYIADKLARTMDKEFEKEALKAQAVLIRTNLMSEEKFEIFIQDESYGKVPVTETHREAAAETKGIYITYEDSPIYAAYYKVSNGSTRDAAEFLTKEKYPYLVSAACNRDFLAEEYVTEVSFGIQEFEKIWKNAETAEGEAEEGYKITRDSAGYVVGVKHDNKWIDGEQMRYMLELPSSCFQIEEGETEIIFTVKGVGHGLGMSQFTANEMAKEGSSYIEIIEYFFKNVTISRY